MGWKLKATTLSLPLAEGTDRWALFSMQACCNDRDDPRESCSVGKRKKTAPNRQLFTTCTIIFNSECLRRKQQSLTKKKYHDQLAWRKPLQQSQERKLDKNNAASFQSSASKDPLSSIILLANDRLPTFASLASATPLAGCTCSLRMRPPSFPSTSWHQLPPSTFLSVPSQLQRTLSRSC